MSVKINDARGERYIVVEGDNERLSESVFIMGPLGFCMEFDRDTFLRAIKEEFTLIEPLEVGLERFMASVA